MVTFDGDPRRAATLVGYGTHGDLVVMTRTEGPAIRAGR